MERAFGAAAGALRTARQNAAEIRKFTVLMKIS
jgi:hypothetical protein